MFAEGAFQSKLCFLIPEILLNIQSLVLAPRFLKLTLTLSSMMFA